jgi:hypothetical protein
LITSTANEAGQIVDTLFPAAVPSSNTTLLSTLSFLVGEERAAALLVSGKYQLGNGEDTFRETFEKIVTDGIWRCPARQVGREWAKNGGRVWVGEWTKGKGYVSNQGGGYCSAKGRVCHEVCPFSLDSCVVANEQDDIMPTFGVGSKDLVSHSRPSRMKLIE